jgi:hypothetical protein
MVVETRRLTAKGNDEEDDEEEEETTKIFQSILQS